MARPAPARQLWLACWRAIPKADLCRSTVDRLVRTMIKEIGYTDPTIGFDADSCQVISHLHKQSGEAMVGDDEERT